MALLKRVKLEGFRSIKETDVSFRALNILIGANGAGKSNFVSFFKMMNEMMGDRLQQYISTTGRAQANLYFGPKVTPQLSARLEFETEMGFDAYLMRLSHAAGDSLVFTEEAVSFPPDWTKDQRDWISLGTGHFETRVGGSARDDNPVENTFPLKKELPRWRQHLVAGERGEIPAANPFRYLLSNCRVFHFHDTSATARVRQYHYVGDHRFLMPDAANLAAMLFRWKQQKELVYERIVRTIQQLAPFFDGFDLAPEGNGDRDIILNWRHRKSDLIFGPHQLSDGTLRAICLITLLLQPEDELPLLIVVDEPELGLHPYALNVIASLFQAAAHHTQILISTQSSTFLDNFAPEDIIVVERDGEASKFSRPDAAALGEWLDEYSLGEVWEKNVIGGGPH
jgi:predicted ATPase